MDNRTEGDDEINYKYLNPALVDQLEEHQDETDPTLADVFSKDDTAVGEHSIR